MPTAVYLNIDTTESPIYVSVDDNNNEAIFISVSDVIAGSGGSAIDNTVIFEGIVGQSPIITGTANTATGFTAGSFTITLADFIGKRVYIERGGQRLPQVDAGYSYAIKSLSSDTILFDAALEDGELIYIHTIPK